MKKNSSIVVIVIFLHIIFNGCSRNTITQNNTITKKDSSKIELKWIGQWKGREGKEKYVRDIAREFEFLNQNIGVKVKFSQEFVQENKSYHEVLSDMYVESIKSGQMPWDIVLMDRLMYSNVAAKLKNQNWGKEYLENLEVYDWFKESHKQFIFTESIYRESTGNMITGPVIEGMYLSLFYNQKVAEKIGLKIKATGMTINDLYDYCEKVDQYNKTTPQKITLFYVNKEQSAKFDNIFNSLIISELDQLSSSSNKAESMRVLKKALDVMEKLSKLNPTKMYSEEISGQDYILNEKALFMINSSIIYNKWQFEDKKKVLNMIPTELPVFEKRGKAYIGRYQAVFAIFKNAPNKEYAIKLMKYMCENDQVEKWLALTKSPTGLKSLINSSDFGMDNIDLFNKQIDKDFGKNIVKDKFSKNNKTDKVTSEFLFGERYAEIDIPIADVIAGKKTANEAYEYVKRQFR